MIIKDSITELKETKVWNYLNEIDSSYAEHAVSLVELLTPILKSIQEIFPLYTRHDAHHSFRVLKRMEQVIHTDCLVKERELSFNHVEAFLLICSAYAHDLGMAVFPEEENQLLEQLGIAFENDWKSNSILQEYLRKHHSERGGRFIDRNYEILSFPRNLVNHLDLLMKTHNMSINELDAQLSKREAGGDSEINLKQLACILCVADSLEYSETRIVDGVLDLLKDRIKNEEDKEALKSYRENMKHVCIGDSLAIGQDNRIVISGSFNDPEVLNLAHKTIDYIEDWVRNYTDIDYRSPLKRLLPLGDKVVRNLSILESDFVRLGIRIKKDHIIKLISSNSTWNDHSVAIKELLQNSVEACRYRLHNSSPADNYSPKITVVVNKKESTIVIKDNGCGMSRNTILDNFLTVGNSRSIDPIYSSCSFKSLARFGIGFWSVFMIAEDANIISAPFEYLKNNGNTSDEVEGLQFNVSVSEFKDYTLFRKIITKPGTIISLTIKPEIKLDDLVTGLNNKLLCSEIPIEIRNDDDLYRVPLNVVLPALKEITKAKYDFALHQEVKEYVFENQYGELEFKMKLLFRICNNQPTFLLRDGCNSMTQLTMSSIFKFKFATCGFAVNAKLDDIDLVFYLGGVGSVICNINNPDGFIFNILRLELLPSKKQEEVMELITNGIHDGYRQFLIDNNGYNKQSIYELNRQSGANYQYSSKYTNQKLNNLQKRYPDLLSFKLYAAEVGKDLSTANVSYMNLDELCSQKYDLWCCNTLNYRGPEKAYIESLPFQLVSDYNKGKSDVFFIPLSLESDMLFDNDPNSFIEILPNPSASDLRRPFIPFMRITSNTVVPTKEHPWVICTVTGIWSGTILGKKIIGGADYIFIGSNMIVNPDSKICLRIRELNENGQIIKLCKLVHLLSEAKSGFIDDSIQEFL